MNNSSIIGISVLSAIFFGALITLVVILRKRLRTSLKLISSQCNRGSMGVLMETCCDEDESGHINYALDDHIYHDELWTSNVVELLPHCMGILKTSQLLTDQVIQAVIATEPSGEAAAKLAGAGHLIASHVDAVVKAMYPPLDLNVLETCCCTLVLSVSSMVVVSRHLASHDLKPLLHDLYHHLKFMKLKRGEREQLASSSCLPSSPPPASHGPPSKKIKSTFRAAKDDNDDELIILDGTKSKFDREAFKTEKASRMTFKQPGVTTF